MKAPNKIFLSVEKGEDWIHAMWTQKNPEEQKFRELDEHEEYIRKDALLEWANNWEKIGVSDDFAYAIQTLIKHIESL